MTDGLGERLDEASGATAAQVELNKKREAEVAKLRKDVEEVNIQHEAVLSNQKRKQGDAVGEMSDQVDALQKMKAKIDKDKITIMNEISDVRAATDEVMRAQAAVDKANHNMLDQLNAINKKVDAASLTLGDYAASKNKISNENADLLRVIGDLENNLNILAKAKSALAAQLSDVKSLCDNEARERQLLLGKFRNLEHELDGAKEVLDEEVAARDNTLRLLSKAEGDASLWRQKYETDAVAKAEELEMTKMKLTARLTEAEATIDNQKAKLAQIEKAKAKIQGEITEMTAVLDQAQTLNAAMERKAKNFDKVISEMKNKVERLSFDLDVVRKRHAMLPPTCSRSRLLMRKLSCSWKRLDVKTKPYPMRSRTSWTRSLRVADPFMRLTKSENAWRLRSLSSRLLLKRLRPHLNRRKIKF